jgi:predicted ATP-grasp superfamily ATP-dependent carboligase
MATTKASKIAGKTVRLSAPGRTPVKKEQVHEALEQIFRLNGCLGCGLLGIDVIIHGGDPEPFDVGGGFNATIR